MSMTTRVLMLTALTGAFIGVCVSMVEAQSSTDSNPPPFVVHWGDGLSIESPDGDTKFQVGALVQVDGRFDADDPSQTVPNALLLRRIRPILPPQARSAT